MEKLYKVVVLGDLEYDGLNRFKRTYRNVLGVDFACGNLDETTTYAIWDINLDEHFRTVVSDFTNGAHAVILDLDALRDKREVVEYALKDLDPKTPIYVVGGGSKRMNYLTRFENIYPLKYQPQITKQHIEMAVSNLNAKYSHPSI